MKNNYMNLRSLKIVLIGVLVFLGLSIGINKLIDSTTPKLTIEDPITGESVSISDPENESIWEPLQNIVVAGDMLFVGCSAIVVAFIVVLLFCRNTAGKHSKSDAIDKGWRDMTDKEKTRWSLGIIIALTCAMIVGSAKGATNSLPVSVDGYNLILKYEVSSKYYYNKYLKRPTVPAWRTTASGCTVGFGSDCGHMSKQQIRDAWTGILTEREIRALQSVSGLKGSRAYYATRKMRHLVSVDWTQADLQFKRYTLPRYTKLTAKAFKIDKDTLHPHSSSALVSLVFNRGSSMGKTSSSSAFDRRMEMRWIRYNISVGKSDRVPSNIRHMKRIWSRTKLKGLHLRRDAEAVLFAKGVTLFRPD
tara:strand:+ start:2837 stop:3922 length:1086 start_codon:yes stop_codon:yes gene_type:complete